MHTGSGETGLDVSRLLRERVGAGFRYLLWRLLDGHIGKIELYLVTAVQQSRVVLISSVD